MKLVWKIRTTELRINRECHRLLGTEAENQQHFVSLVQPSSILSYYLGKLQIHTLLCKIKAVLRAEQIKQKIQKF
jgi:hypothetical protein